MFAPKTPPDELAIIVAMTGDRLIGSADGLPWSRPDDLQLFKRLTDKSTLVMGRRTFAAIGRPLPNRHNIVISRSQTPQAGIILVPDFATALQQAVQFGRPVFFIGGHQVYRSALAIANHLHISWIEGQYAGDTWFPDFDLDDWLQVEQEQFSGFRYCHYLRKAPAVRGAG